MVMISNEMFSCLHTSFRCPHTFGHFMHHSAYAQKLSVNIYMIVSRFKSISSVSNKTLSGSTTKDTITSYSTSTSGLSSQDKCSKLNDRIGCLPLFPDLTLLSAGQHHFGCASQNHYESLLKNLSVLWHDRAVVTIRFGLDTKTTWLGLRKDDGFGQNKYLRMEDVWVFVPKPNQTLTIVVSGQKMVKLIILEQWSVMVSEGTDKQCCPALFCYLVRRTCCLHQYDVSAWQPCLCNVSLLFLFFILDLDMRVLNFYNRYCLAVSVLSAVLMGLICVVVWSAVKTRVFFVLYIGLPVTAQSSTTNCCQTSLQFCWTPSAIISRKEKKKNTVQLFAHHSNGSLFWLTPAGSL